MARAVLAFAKFHLQLDCCSGEPYVLPGEALHLLPTQTAGVHREQEGMVTELLPGRCESGIDQRVNVARVQRVVYLGGRPERVCSVVPRQESANDAVPAWGRFIVQVRGEVEAAYACAGLHPALIVMGSEVEAHGIRPLGQVYAFTEVPEAFVFALRCAATMWVDGLREDDARPAHYSPTRPAGLRSNGLSRRS